MPDGFLNVHHAEIVTLAARYGLPTVYPWRFFPEIGGLLSYGNEQRDSFRLAATYIDRILKGARLATSSKCLVDKPCLQLKRAHFLGSPTPGERRATPPEPENALLKAVVIRLSSLAASSNRRRFANSFALSARLRQRSACAFKKLVSILPPNATNHPILCDVL